jgi:hypothetical protein
MDFRMHGETIKLLIKAFKCPIVVNNFSQFSPFDVFKVC